MAEGRLTVAQLSVFFEDYVMEVGRVEALFCRAAYRLHALQMPEEFETTWLKLNMRLSALNPPAKIERPVRCWANGYYNWLVRWKPSPVWIRL